MSREHDPAKVGTPSPPQWFVTTHWSVVLSAKAGLAEQAAAAALSKLCEDYWLPLYYFTRRKGYEHHDANDLTQEFFRRLLACDFLRNVDPSKGKFRSFLLGAMQNFLAKEWRRANAQKRGGKCDFISLDAASAEERYLQSPASTFTPEQLYDREWYQFLLNKAMNRLRVKMEAEGDAEFFEKTKICLTGERQAGFYQQLATERGTTVGALKMAVIRMQERWRELLREEIAQTVSTWEEVDDELRAMVSILGT
jgi:RNA polymerase sigma-70 factor (ECF subfamily)